jgi:flagellar motor switch protein FliM
LDLKDVISANEISRIKIGYNIVNNPEIKITTIKTHNVISIKELKREFIFSFVLSVLARYQISKWMEILSGGDGKIILKIRRYFESIQLLFPNLILNELYDKFLEFYSPTQFAIVEMDKYDIPLDL